MTYYDDLIESVEDGDEDEESLEDEFEDTGDPVKPFKTEHAFEGLTERNSRYKKWKAD